MKRILITGANSYIGTSFEKYINDNFPSNYSVDTVDMIDGTWRQKDFGGYDAVFHVAGIAHQKETKENAHLYYEINRDLPTEVARKAKEDGVKQFVFLSSMSVYGLQTGVVTKETQPSPNTNYGKSKLQAEELLNELEGTGFTLTVLRPPMVYGEGCKGNYQTLAKLVKKLPFFPKVNNERSMIYIDNLVSFVRMIIDKNISGIFFPQDREYVNTSDIANNIAEKLGKKIYLSRFLGLGVTVLMPFSKTVKKAFGNLVYKDTEDFNFEYCLR